MKVIQARNVCDAYPKGLALLREEGVRQSSRAGEVLVAPWPVTTVYERPAERVLMDPRRDANPVFHVMEALWMLAGRDDARWLDRFVRDFSSRFAEDNGHQHGAYGRRWRNWFAPPGAGAFSSGPRLDQLDEAVRLLRANPDDRRVVIQMWDASSDLGAHSRDVPCNLLLLPRVVDGRLDVTSCVRSHDFVWGLAGANSVHLTMLQEYLAGRIGIPVGKFYFFSNNFHVYTEVLERVWPEGQQMRSTLRSPPSYERGDIVPAPMGQDWDAWDDDLARFVQWTDAHNSGAVASPQFVNSWFATTAVSMFVTHWEWKHGDREAALAYAETQIAALDWRAAALAWMRRRMTK